MIIKFRKLLSLFHGKILSLYDHLTECTLKISVGDVILQRGGIDHCQFLLSSRFLDVKEYIENNDSSFRHRNTIARVRWGKNHKEEIGNKHFSSLIESYKVNGYNSSSCIKVDRNCRLIDGNHRMGTNLYFKINDISVRLVKRESNFAKNIDFYFQNKLPTEYIEEVLRGYHLIQEWLVESGNTFCCIIENFKQTKQLLSDLKILTNVLSIKSCNSFSNKSIVWGGVYCPILSF